MKLNDRDRYALQYALDRPGVEFDASTLARHQLHEAVTSGDEELAERLRRQANAAVGWGHNLRRLSEAGLVFRWNYAGVWVYELKAGAATRAREALNHPTSRSPAATTPGDIPAEVEETSNA